MDEPKLAITKVDDPLIQELVASCDEEYAELLELTPQEYKKLVKYVRSLRSGEHSLVPMICLGEVCMCKRACPLVEMGKPPIGKQCPFEIMAQKVWLNDYIKSLNVNIEDKVERSLVMDIVEADILNARANVVLGTEGFIMENAVGIDPDSGRIITRKEEHVVLKFKERAQNRKDKLLKAFLATRESKIKAVRDMPEDPTQYLSRLRRKVEKLFKQHNIIDMTVDKSKETTNVVANSVETSVENIVQEEPKEQEHIDTGEELF